MLSRYIYIVLAALLLPLSGAVAQGVDVADRVYGTFGHNYSEGFYGSVAALVDVAVADAVTITAGVEGFRAKGMAATVGLRSMFTNLTDRLFVINRYLWRRLGRWNTDEFSAHAGVGYRSLHWLASLGVASRFVKPVRPYGGGGGTEFLFEPFNLMYELQYSFVFGKGSAWGMALRVADWDWFLTDRAYQPLFSIAMKRSLDEGLDVAARVVCQPTGMLSLSANYYHLFVNFGVEKRW